MTITEFKKLKPELASLEGEDLWNAMEDYVKGKPTNIFDNKPPSASFSEYDVFKYFRKYAH